MTISEISKKCGLNDEEKKAFLEYISNRFCNYHDESKDDFLFLDRWKMIYNFAQEYSPSKAINMYVCHKRQVNFRYPELIRIEIYKSFAGEIPIIYVPDIEDFENLVTNLIYKGVRPEQLSQTGASFAFAKSTRFIILSSKPYSNIPACELELDEADWANKSMIIRREHECTHYFTKLHYGIARNCLHDELIADFFGLYEAFGYYKAEYFLKFMGVISGSGDRLKFYTSEFSPKFCFAIEETARSAADFLEQYSQTEIFMSMNRKEQVKKICSMGLAEMCN